MELNDIYDAERRLTGRLHQRGTPWKPGEYGLVACVWVYDGRGNLLLTRRAREKSYPGTWENSGGAAKAAAYLLMRERAESVVILNRSREKAAAVARELFEETGIRAPEEDFELIDSARGRDTFFDFYCLERRVALRDIVLLPGETDDVMWASFDRVHAMIRRGQISSVIAAQFIRQEAALKARQNIQK